MKTNELFNLNGKVDLLTGVTAFLEVAEVLVQYGVITGINRFTLEY